MVLVTGGTGFVGRSLLRQLVENGYSVRVLLRPSRQNPALPAGIPLEVAVTSMDDPRGLRAAMVGVDVIYHLAGSEWQGARARLIETDIRGTQAITAAAADAGVDRIFSLSHLGANRASAYPVLKTKGIAEEHLRRAGPDYTILRSSLLFGKDDSFTTTLAMLCHALPFIFFLPGDGQTMLQPLWVEDLVTCLAWALEEDSTRNHTFELGGPEYFSFRQVLQTIMRTIGIERALVTTRTPYLRMLTSLLETVFPGLPVSSFWLDYLAVNRTTGLDTLPRVFGVLPSRFPSKIDYLRSTNWGRQLRRSLFRTRSSRIGRR
jgi:NADH dehydrogenase